jgi:hypothetical protein
MEHQTLFQFDTSVRRPLARGGDPETSHEAARSIVELTEKQEFLRALLRREGPSTDEEIWNHMIICIGFPLMSESGARTRRAELVAMNAVRDSGKRRKTRSGRNAIVWEGV